MGNVIRTLEAIMLDIEAVKAELKKMNARQKNARRHFDLQTIIDINTHRVSLLDELNELEEEAETTLQRPPAPLQHQMKDKNKNKK